MTDQPVYVVSDIHLGGVPPATERAFRAFLAHLHGRTSELLINGDLFDFWFEYGSVIQSRHYRVLAALTDLRESGVRIRFLGGNHDAWGGKFLTEQVGIEMVREGEKIDLGGRRALVVHGDGRGRGDLGYRALKKVIRNPVSVVLFRLLHPDLGSRLASVVSTTQGKQGTPHAANPVRAAELRRWAAEQLEQRPDIDLVLAGHTHTPVVEEVQPGRFYINTGDWINHFTYLILPPAGPPELLRWEGSV
jgi:UDP-2,3-diacylglucosamine hydrolase